MLASLLLFFLCFEHNKPWKKHGIHAQDKKKSQIIWRNTGYCCGAMKINLLIGESLSGCENNVKKRSKLKCLSGKGMIYDLCLVYHEKKYRYGKLVHQDSVCWGSSQQKFFQYKGNLMRQARHKINCYDVRETISSMSATAGVLIVEKLNMVL